MDMRTLSPDYTVSPQITVEDINAIAAAGFKSVICNRPDGENPPEQKMAVIQAAAETAGLTWAENPFDPKTFGAAIVARQKELLDSLPGPVFAYCASGNRSSIAWAFSMADRIPADDLIAAAHKVGYNLDHLKPALDQITQG